jgi:hypothetical protein
MKKSEMIWKWAAVILLCTTLIAVSIIIRDYRIMGANLRANNLAVTLANLNGMVSDVNMVTQINDVLAQNGYPNLQREISPEVIPPAPEEVEEEIPEEE